ACHRGGQPSPDNQRGGGTHRTSVARGPGNPGLKYDADVRQRRLIQSRGNGSEGHLRATIPARLLLPGATTRVDIDEATGRPPLRGWTDKIGSALSWRPQSEREIELDLPPRCVGRSDQVAAPLLQSKLYPCRRLNHFDAQPKRKRSAG